MKKVILTLLVLMFTLNVGATLERLRPDQYMVYIERDEYKNTFNINYDTNEIHLNFDGFENKTFKFKGFRTMVFDYEVVNVTTAVCDGVEYDVRAIYSITTRQSYYIFTDKKTGGAIEYRFG